MGVARRFLDGECRTGLTLGARDASQLAWEDYSFTCVWLGRAVSSLDKCTRQGLPPHPVLSHDVRAALACRGETLLSPL